LSGGHEGGQSSACATGWAAPAFGLKAYLHPADLKMFEARKEDGHFRILSSQGGPLPKRVYFGIRACDVAAAIRLDRVLTGDRYVDPVFARRRRGSLIVAASCHTSAETCFCASAGTGPRPKEGFDILIEEIEEGGATVFVASAGSVAGADILAAAAPPEASGKQKEAAVAAAGRAAAAQTRKVSFEGLRDALYEAFDHPRWDATASRCLSCGNCTSACPTCFCVTVDEATTLDGRTATRLRRWDSCFTQGFTYIHGGSVRLSPKSRYRQWLTHKFAAWQDQFGVSGCVGCGRCITWCPAGIDVTEEIGVIRPAAAGK
jgi:ferredoxin